MSSHATAASTMMDHHNSLKLKKKNFMLSIALPFPLTTDLKMMMNKSQVPRVASTAPLHIME